MKGCIHDYTIMQDECDCYVPHTNFADTGMPHESLVQYIAQLERERDALARQLVATMHQRDLFAASYGILLSAAT